jgi:hypothetical protein
MHPQPPTSGSVCAADAPSAGSARGRFGAFDRYILVLLALPAALLLFNRNWNFTDLHHWDDWFPVGYWINFKMMLVSWDPGTYRAGRLPWNLTGWFVHHWLDTVTANYLLHTLIFLVAAISCYLLLRGMTGRRNALVFSILLGGHPQFMTAVGHDYPDGFGIALNFAGLLLAERAARGVYPRICLMLAGAAAASMFYTNLFLLAFAPFILLFYWFLRYEGWTAGTLRRIWPGTLWFVAGAAGLTLALAAVNYRLEGKWWFYASNLRFATSKFKQDDGVILQGLAWMRSAFWLAQPAAVLAAVLCKTPLAALRRVFRPGDPRSFVAVHCALSSLLVIWWETQRGWALELDYYCSYFLVTSGLLLGIYAAGAVDRWKPGAFWTLIGLLIAACSFAACNPAGRWWLSGEQRGFLAENSLAILGAAVLTAILIRFAAPRRSLSYAASVAILTATIFANTAVAPVAAPRSDNEQRLRRIHEAARLILAVSGGERTTLWFSETDPMGDEMRAVDSTLHRFYLSRSFPAIVKDPWSLSVVPMMRLGVLSSLPPAEIVRQAKASLRAVSFDAVPIAAHRVESDGAGFNIVLMRADQVDSRPLRSLAIGEGKPRQLHILEPGAATPNALTACWIEDSANGLAESAPGGIRVHGGDTDFAYGARCGPLVVPVDGTYRITFRYRVIQPNVYFGVLSGDAQTWLAQTPPFMADGASRVQVATVPLKAGDRILLMTANMGKALSDSLLESLTAEVRSDTLPRAQTSRAAPGAMLQ